MGLVGRVLETGARSSRVLLLTDPESLVPVRRSTDNVVAFAEGPLPLGKPAEPSPCEQQAAQIGAMSVEPWTQIERRLCRFKIACRRHEECLMAPHGDVIALSVSAGSLASEVDDDMGRIFLEHLLIAPHFDGEAGGGRNMQARLGHQGQQANRF